MCRVDLYNCIYVAFRERLLMDVATVVVIDVFLTNVSFDVRLRWNFLMELFMDTHVGCMMVDRLLWSLLDDTRSKLMDGKWIGRGVLWCLKINRWFWENRPLILETSTLDFDNINPWCWGKSAHEFWKILPWIQRNFENTKTFNFSNNLIFWTNRPMDITLKLQCISLIF